MWNSGEGRERDFRWRLWAGALLVFNHEAFCFQEICPPSPCVGFSVVELSTDGKIDTEKRLRYMAVHLAANLTNTTNGMVRITLG